MIGLLKILSAAVAVIFALSHVIACASSGGNNGETGGISIQGVIAGNSNNLTVADLLFKGAGIPSDCPDSGDESYALTLVPTADSFRIATRYVRFLKEGGNDYYEIPDCTHDLASEAEAASVTIGNAATTICTLEGAIPTEAVATFDGIEMAIYYVQMTVPMIVPYLSAEEANYPLRIYFNDDEEQGILARDILVLSEADGKWGWINYEDETITFTDQGRPTGALLDAFANDAYWCADCDANPELCPEETDRRSCSAANPTWSYKDPVTISTRDTSGGTDFRMSNDSFTISSSDESHTLALSFDVADTLTAWENADDVDNETHTLDISRDCGFHPLFPSVTITESAD